MVKNSILICTHNEEKYKKYNSSIEQDIEDLEIAIVLLQPIIQLKKLKV